MLPEKAIKEFIEIHKKETGITLSVEEATPLALNLIELFKVLLKSDGKLQSKASSILEYDNTKD